MELKILDSGVTDYGEMLTMQRMLHSRMVERKKSKDKIDTEYLILTEHLPVVTLGRHANEDNLLMTSDCMMSRGIGVYHIERGGDVTYHGPGQLVVYPLIDLEYHHLGVKDYVDMLEEVVIRTIAAFGLRGERVNGASGVWIGRGTPGERKICALGVKCSRYVTMHGLALNVNTDMSGFEIINPCGFKDKGVTSMARELGREIPMEEVKKIIGSQFKIFLQKNLVV